jgi:hypothetical protein
MGALPDFPKDRSARGGFYSRAAHGPRSMMPSATTGLSRGDVRRADLMAGQVGWSIAGTPVITMCHHQITRCNRDRVPTGASEE